MRKSVSSIINPLNKNMVYIEYTLNDKKSFNSNYHMIKKIFTFLVRTMNSGKHFFDGSYRGGIEYYSIITEKKERVQVLNLDILPLIQNILFKLILLMLFLKILMKINNCTIYKMP